MTEKILFVCTANVCRSPMAEALLRSRLAGSGIEVEVRSAGFLREGSAADRHVLWAMRRMGLDLSHHQSALVRDALASNPDLILAMAREHLRLISAMEPGLMGRAFTLKEFVQLAGLEGERRPGESMELYLERLGAVRSPSSVFAPGSGGDVEDPIGRRRGAFERCAVELNELVGSAATLLYPMADPVTDL